ncbi:glycosyltransferase family 1 protein [Geobacter sulfurreducens]|jgi:starch phosphorylase|uniref:Alpha-glucan phosphorylase n=1 Tax=Geobacter sulfurreducens (strain ATCC 51573 / DSM 12127 / PCA) TaxID=243231 RepID=Q74G76_GEOSL|nr:glycosyltransferase family 1 protein [Geobacter sulfurreducens]AAR33703.1 alpha-glucan phosphorylase [Geobacter sulfurreducens PCA]ADI83202.1 alpha-glucan phosphorylase [Geobacter sulfurreducens KN400]AJY70096.1 alpha-glucan phosphorylase [Geobacter sulfurreducens]QVW35630.1 glycosyltransferase family 1 protein [Geobacter sulfurreducens]UAC04454.1 glycosyltransferase family 1 protein [Geobacter sulfurreducens]
MDFTKRIHRFTVVPSLSGELAILQTLAYNLWWTWEPDAVELFKRLDIDLWQQTRHNPVEMLGILQQTTLERLVADEGFMAQLKRVEEKYHGYMTGKTWFDRTWNGERPLRVAYFSMEFGLHESVPTYSGGLGVLAGDHLKSASDLGIPLVGIGLLYRQGYFRQYLNIEGWQQELYPENDFYNLPLKLQRDEEGQPVTIELDLAGRKVHVQIWKVQVGRIPLYLLDTNMEENDPLDREITAQLYGGDQDMRIRQEILLGIGGIRALNRLGIDPNVCHMNEGHAAFLALERTKLLMEKHGLRFPEAMEAVRAGTIFTTHTPVDAGIDHFPADLLERYLGRYYRFLGLSRDEFLSLGRQLPKNPHESFCMAVLALRLANHANGVSQLHGEVSRKMWKNLWPELPDEHIPITSVTNGVHTKTWLSVEMAGLLTRYLGNRWREDPTDSLLWKRVANIPDSELWRTHERCRERLVVFARRRLKDHLHQVGATAKEIAQADEVLDPEALTIGFARRFATYKRGTLLFRDLDRLARILNDADRPVQIIFSGKAHPHDVEGKELIRRIFQHSLEARFHNRIVFIEDYDMAVARHLVQGVDVWLNTPLRPLEASGTSGMKVAFNGGLNMSVLDGWWPEGYRGNNGWAIGKGEVYDDIDFQNEVESRAIYDLLEKEVIPLFYDRGPDGIPRGWLACMKASLQTLCPVFSTERMVKEYAERMYLPSFEEWRTLAGDGLARAVDLARWKGEMHRSWHQVKVISVEAPAPEEVPLGAPIPVTARIALGDIVPDRVIVETYCGVLDSRGNIVGGELIPLDHAEEEGGGSHRFTGDIETRFCGRHGFMIRVMPRHPELGPVYEQGLLVWG